MAAIHLYPASLGNGMLTDGGTAQGLLLPLIVGIGVLGFLLSAIVALSPTDAEIREDAALREWVRTKGLE